MHQAKLDLLIAECGLAGLERLKEYFRKVETDFPHHIFQTGEHRSSKFPSELQPTIVRKENNATRLAALALPTSPNNKKRHETLQRFMLNNDSVTVAVEIPVYLAKEDIAYYAAEASTSRSKRMRSPATLTSSRSEIATSTSSITSPRPERKSTRTCS